MSFAENMKTIRKQKGLSQKDLADRLGVTPAMVSAYENGKRLPKLQNIKRIAAALGCTGDDLIGTNHSRDTITPTQIDISDFSQDEIKEINNYLDFVKYKRTRDN